MKKVIILLVFALLLMTTTLLFANNNQFTEEVPGGAAENETSKDGKTTETRILKNGKIIINQYNMSFVEDDRGNWYTFESLDLNSRTQETASKKENADRVENKEDTQEAIETKVIEKTRESEKTKENQESQENEKSLSEVSGAAEKGQKVTSSKSSEEVVAVAATPPRAPKVPSYSMDRVGIYHNNEGAVTVVYPGASVKRLKVLVEKGGERSAYNLHNGTETANAVETYPLQRGDGTYAVRIMENTEGNKYREVYRQEVTLKSTQKHAVYLNSIQEIKWETSDPAIQKAAELTAGKSADMEKVKAVYNYVTRNVQYDYDKVDRLTTFYLPNINDTYSTNDGICYDYASIFAAMLRSQGIPTRMVKGYSDAIGNGEVYHAWNEVYLESEDRWVIIDTTHDAPAVQRGESVNMIKGSGGFTVTHRL